MSDKPRKTLSITRKPASDTHTPASTENGTQAVKRTRKRIIKRDELPAVKLGKPKSPPPKAKKPKAPNKPKPIKSPSDLRAEELAASLNNFPVWRERQPLAIGIEREIFQHIARHQLSASKRVVQKLLYWQTNNRKYLQAVGAGGSRYHLDGTEAGAILPEEREHAGRVLAGGLK